MSAVPQEPRVVWKPLAGSQTLAMTCPCNFILFEGTRGPGKTDSQLMKFRRYVGMGYGRFWRGIIFDREYKNLDDLVSKSLRWYPEFFDGARWLSSRSDYKWVWPTGEELLFRQAKKPSDYYNYHGQEFPFIGWNELTKYPTPELFDAMMSTNRSSFRPQDHPQTDQETNEQYLLPEIPLMVFSTTNPYGPGHNWVKLRFIDPAPPGKVVRITTNVFNPRTQQREDITKTQVRIFGSYKENIYLSPEYIAELESITDPNKHKAWLWGDWDVVAGGAFDGVWDESIHIKKRFKIPSGWKIDRSFDWGSSHPFSVAWWAESNGEYATMPDGSRWSPPAGSLILLHEWYGSKQIGMNQGILMSAKDIAQGIRKRESELVVNHWVPQGRIRPGPADSQIYQVREKDVDTIAKKMEDYGVRWIPADKSPGSRINGLELARGMLENAIRGEGPGLYFMDHCRAHISLLPTLPRDEDNLDDVDTDSEDHVWDGTRYRVLKGSNRYATVIPLRFAG
ncbi:MAG: hypothetical protein M0P09_01315 [Acholeplasmataceae bacterium]|nr:hypothetical protein [Acholeplasmataceae bacterium]